MIQSQVPAAGGGGLAALRCLNAAAVEALPASMNKMLEFGAPQSKDVD